MVGLHIVMVNPKICHDIPVAQALGRRQFELLALYNGVNLRRSTVGLVIVIVKATTLARSETP
jgi:hypothetical protein